MKLYRVMKLDADGRPLIGTRRNMLGVRPTDPNNKDPRRRADTEAVNPVDPVRPGEGLSTSLDPTVLRVGSGEALFEIEAADLGPYFRPNPDHPPHCLIEPTAPVALADFQQALASTRDLWEQVQ